MTRIIPALIALLTLAACGDPSDNYEIAATRGCNDAVSPLLEGQSHPVRCGPQQASPHGGR